MVSAGVEDGRFPCALTAGRQLAWCAVSNCCCLLLLALMCRPTEQFSCHKLRRGRWQAAVLRVTAHAGASHRTAHFAYLWCQRRMEERGMLSCIDPAGLGGLRLAVRLCGHPQDLWWMLSLCYFSLQSSGWTPAPAWSSGGWSTDTWPPLQVLCVASSSRLARGTAGFGQAWACPVCGGRSGLVLVGSSVPTHSDCRVTILWTLGGRFNPVQPDRTCVPLPIPLPQPDCWPPARGSLQARAHSRCLARPAALHASTAAPGGRPC